MSEPLVIELPWPPSDNALKTSIVINGQSRTLLSKQAREYYTQVAAVLLEKGTPKIHGPCRVDVVLYPPDRRVIDPTNRLKAIMDSLKRREIGRRRKGERPKFDSKQWAWVFAEDDSQAVEGSWSKREVCRPNGKAIVTLTKLDGAVQGDMFEEAEEECRV